MASDDAAVRAIHCVQRADSVLAIALIGFRRLCCFVDYDAASRIVCKLSVDEYFTYSPLTSPQMFFLSAHSDSNSGVAHIFCRNFGSALRIDLASQTKELIRVAGDDRLSSKGRVLSATRSFVIWAAPRTPSDFYAETRNAHKNENRDVDGRSAQLK